MIAITKKSEPGGLKKLRKKAFKEGLTPARAYKRLKDPLKTRVRNALVAEQGQLCAYCMCRIPRSDAGPEITPIIIEHCIPRNPRDKRNVGQGLNYNNLLAVCHGNRASKGLHNMCDLTCDAHRGNTEFRKVNPCKPETLTTIFYRLDGEIDAYDPDVQYDLVKTLNLNCPTSPLVAERKAVLDNLIEELSFIPMEDLYEYCKLSLIEFESETNPKTPYVGIIIWYLKSMIEALEN